MTETEQPFFTPPEDPLQDEVRSLVTVFFYSLTTVMVLTTFIERVLNDEKLAWGYNPTTYCGWMMVGMLGLLHAYQNYTKNTPKE